MTTFKMIRGRSGVFSFKGEIVGQTMRAIKVDVDGHTLWLPKSALTADYTLKQWFGLSPAQMAIVEPVSAFHNGADGRAELPASETIDRSEIARIVAEQVKQAGEV